MSNVLSNLAETLTYSPYSTTSVDGGSAGWLSAGVLLPLLVLALVTIVGMWKTFQKAGRPGWAAIVPIYNVWVLSEIAGRPGWWGLAISLLPIIPFVGWIPAVVMMLIVDVEVAHKFGRSTVFGVLGLFLFSFVGYIMLGFGQDRYQDATNVDPGAPATPAAV